MLYSDFGLNTISRKNCTCVIRSCYFHLIYQLDLSKMDNALHINFAHIQIYINIII